MTRDASIAVYVEQGKRRTFAAAADWPGWCRAGKDEEAALAALVAYIPRYAEAVGQAGLAFPADAAARLEIVERLPGSATTDFGAPGSIAAGDERPVDVDETGRLSALVSGAWRVFDRVVSAAPASLRKGPRGGGRDRDAIVDHVLGAEVAYARLLGAGKLTQPDQHDLAAVDVFRNNILNGLEGAVGSGRVAEAKWPVRYAARRVAWHVLDHAWEIEDRS